MKCSIPAQNVKILGRIVHAMAKIGDDLYVESSADGLAFRTINSSDSAYCRVVYDRSFFAHYDAAEPGDDGFKCKISTRSILAVFKSPSHADKRVEACEIRSDPDGTKLVFRLRCKHGVVKTHHLSILESKNMDVSYDADSAPNRISSQHKVLSETVSNFQPSEDQLTFEASPSTFILKNYANDSEPSRTTRTKLAVRPAEFESYAVKTDASVTFSMREFRAMLSLAEAVNLSVTMHFETGGRPIVFVLNDGKTFEADFVIATERPDFGTQSTSATTTKNTGKRKSNYGENDENPTKRSHVELFSPAEDRLFDFADLTESISNGIGRGETDGEAFGALPISNTQKIKTVFRRCFDTTIANSHYEVFAEESDSE